MKCVCTPALPSDTNIYKYVPHALQHTYEVCSKKDRNFGYKNFIAHFTTF